MSQYPVDASAPEPLAEGVGGGGNALHLPVLIPELPKDDRLEFDDQEAYDFFVKIAEGYEAVETGLSMGWSPATIKRFQSDPERAEILEALRERELDGMERTIKRIAHGGNAQAAMFVLRTKGAHRGWADNRNVQVDVREQKEVVISVRQAMTEQTQRIIEEQGAVGVAALQAAFLDDDIAEGEVVD